MKKILFLLALFIAAAAYSQNPARFRNGIRVDNSMILTPGNAPLSPVKGQVYYDDTQNVIYRYDGTQWKSIGSADLQALTQTEYNALSALEKSQFVGYIVEPGSGQGDASDIAYDNAFTGYGASNVQQAIDEGFSNDKDEQTLFFTDPILSILNGNSVDLSSLSAQGGGGGSTSLIALTESGLAALPQAQKDTLDAVIYKDITQDNDSTAISIYLNGLKYRLQEPRLPSTYDLAAYNAFTQTEKDTLNAVIKVAGTNPVTQYHVADITAQGGDVITGTSLSSIYFTEDVTITNVWATVGTAGTTDEIQVDVNEAGVSILSTPITIDATETSSNTAAIPPVISDNTIAAFNEITFDVDQADTGNTGATLKVIVEYTFSGTTEESAVGLVKDGDYLGIIQGGTTASVNYLAPLDSTLTAGTDSLYLDYTHYQLGVNQDRRKLLKKNNGRVDVFPTSEIIPLNTVWRLRTGADNDTITLNPANNYKFIWDEQSGGNNAVYISGKYESMYVEKVATDTMLVVGPNLVQFLYSEPSTLPLANLIHYWRFNGNGTDDEGALTASTTGDAVFTGTGKFNSAYEGDGTDGYASTADAVSTTFGNGTTDNPFSVSGWFSWDGHAEALTYLVDKSGGGYEWRVSISGSSKLEFTLLSQGGSVNYIKAESSTTILNNATWYHFVVTYSGNGSETGLNLYLNGASDNPARSETGTYVAMSDVASGLFFGTFGQFIPAYEFDGRMQSIGIWNKELTAQEVSDLYTKENGNQYANQ